MDKDTEYSRLTLRRTRPITKTIYEKVRFVDDIDDGGEAALEGG